MTAEGLTIRPAVSADLEPLKQVIERAYRGDSARGGWTHEADLVEGERITPTELAALVAAQDTQLLVALQGQAPIGCVAVTNEGDDSCYLGLLCIDPELQSAGLGKQLIDAAESTAQHHFSAHVMAMTVIEQRQELIAYYERRGYARTGKQVPFVVPLDPPLFMERLEKPLRAN